jgi:hypothetical protein
MSKYSRIISYGSSVLYGSELPTGSKSMSALIAEQLGAEYLCRAKPMSSNTKITRKILSYEKYQSGDFVIVMWTGPNRYEFKTPNGWKGFTTYSNRDAFITEWFNGPGDLEYTEVMTTLKEMCLAQQFLETKQIPYVFTADYNTVKDSYTFNNPDAYIASLKNNINWDRVVYFDSQGFIPWAKEKCYEFVGTHPSTEAHQAGANIILSLIHI